MSNKKILIVTAGSLQGILDNAGENTDFKKLFEELIPGVQVIETNAASLAEQLAAVQKELEAANGTIVVLNKKIDDYSSIHDKLNAAYQVIKKQDEKLEAAGSLQEELDAALEQVSELGKMLDLQQGVRDGSVIVQVAGVAKKLLGDRFHLKGEVQMNAQEISKRPDLLQKMVDMGSDAIVDLDSAAGQQVNVTAFDLE